jgi:choline dehydrogenase-like flavoprotein
MSKGRKLEAARAMAGPDPACGDCGRRESFIAVKHLIHHLAPGVLLCGACVMQLKAHGVMHTAEAKAKLVGVSALISRRRTEDVPCENCAVPESSQLTRQHIYNAEVGQVFCSACDSYRRMFGRDRDPSHETSRQAFQNMDKQREEGMPVHCEQCNGAETPGALHHYNHNTGKVLCKACDLYHRKHGKDRDVSKEIRRQGMVDVKQKRKGGVPMNCDQCNTAETPGTSHIFNAKSNKLLCIACDNYHRRTGQDRDPATEARRQALADIKKKRADGVPIYCDECSKTETPADTGRKRFACSGATNRLLCMT